MAGPPINVTLVGDQQLLVRVERMKSTVQQALYQAVLALSLRMEARVKDKLSGEVLNVVTGALRRSIASSVTQSGTGVTGRVYSGGDVKYAAIHEFGGTIHIPDIYPTAGKALHFFAGGAEIFATHVAAHNVVMPERSYMRSTLSDMASEIRAALVAAIGGAAKQT